MGKGLIFPTKTSAQIMVLKMCIWLKWYFYKVIMGFMQIEIQPTGEFLSIKSHAIIQ